MISIIPGFLLQCHIHVYCLTCVIHALQSGYSYVLCVCSLCLVTIDQLDCPAYALLVLHLSLYIPLEFVLVVTVLSVRC